jgi:DNA-binding response OmpR family regulator
MRVSAHALFFGKMSVKEVRPVTDKTILVVEDEASLADLIRSYFVKAGFTVCEASGGKDALSLFESRPIDLVILDVMLEDMDGWSILRELRHTSDVPVLMLTARSQESDKLFGFDLGADDYMTKPFSLKELLARSKALLKRAGSKGEETVFSYGRLSVDKKAHLVRVDGIQLDLTPKEFDLLVHMISHGGDAVTREDLLRSVWGYDYFGDLRTVDTHIKRLRQKLRPLDPIETVFGIGYRFNQSAL